VLLFFFRALISGVFVLTIPMRFVPMTMTMTIPMCMLFVTMREKLLRFRPGMLFARSHEHGGECERCGKDLNLHQKYLEQ
jgi:hypothetical protein